MIDPAERDAAVAATAVCLRALLIVRSALAVALLLGAGSWPAAGLLLLASAAEFLVRDQVLKGAGRGLVFLTADFAVLLGVLALSDGGPVFFGAAAAWSALAGVLLGVRAAPLWLAAAAQAWTVGVAVAAHPALPPLIALAGVAAAVCCRLLARRNARTAAEMADAQRSAVAMERARLARELHDSVAKTVRGMSVAALALPRSVGEQPQLALRLADAISSAAEAAERETRTLLSGLRLESPAEDFADAVARLCRAWSADCGIPVHLEVQPVKPPVPVRYELARILHEALTNVARHAQATSVLVMVRRHERTVSLVVRDNGTGFAVPADLTATETSHGLVGMTERAQTVGGDLTIVSEHGHGTIVTARVPT
jgi:signal transduction histidine kinase